MKKLYFLTIGIALLAMASCGNGDKLKDAEERNAQLEGDVNELISAQDSLLMLVNDITEGMNQIKELEKIISAPGGLNGETQSRKEQIKNDIIAIQQALEERRQRLDEMEKKLAASNSENATLRKTIASLKTQIADQQTEIATLTNQLAAANIKIEEQQGTITRQNEQISNLNEAVANETQEREIAQKEAAENAAAANTVYYCMGSKSELQSKGILTNKFLKKAKFDPTTMDLSYFTKADKRTFTSINTHAKKIEIMTPQPKNSYTIDKSSGEAILTITNPTAFWSASNLLVIKLN